MIIEEDNQKGGETMDKKIIEGWFQMAEHWEYGPTLVKYIGREKGFTPYPMKGARTCCDHVCDEKWEEVELLPKTDNFDDSCKSWRAKIIIEIYEEREHEEKPKY